MNVKNLVVLIGFINLSITGFSQTGSAKDISVSQVIKNQSLGQDKIGYSNLTYGYELIIPKWWEIKEAPSPNFFGGTLPEIGKSKSAVIFKAFEKDKFKTLENFENWVIAGYKSGATPKWSEDQKVLFKKNLTEFDSIGKAYKVQLKAGDSFYNCCYILVETSKSYLWIDLTATRETYDANFRKLESIMSEFKAL